MKVRIWSQKCESNVWVDDSPVYIFEGVDDLQDKVSELCKAVALKAKDIYKDDVVCRFVIQLSPVAGVWTPYDVFGPYNTSVNTVEVFIDVIRSVIEKS